MTLPTTTEEQLDEFVLDATKFARYSYSRWLERDESLKVFVRKSLRAFGHGEMRRHTTMLDIASVNAYPEGTGRFTRFLTYVEGQKPFDGILIENVQTVRFADFFRFRVGYREIESELPLPASFYVIWDELAVRGR